MTPRKLLLTIAALPVIALLPAANSAYAQGGVNELRLFEKDCTSCHGAANAPAGAPDGLALRKMTPEAVYAAMSKGAHLQMSAISDDDKRMIALYLGGRKVDVAKVTDAKLMPNQCPTNGAIGNIAASPMYNGWGVDATNSRFQPAKQAGLSADQVPKLKLKWAFGFPAAEIMWGQPTVADGKVFIGNDTGAVYSIDAATGCVHWSFQSDAGVRNAIDIAPIKGAGAAKYAVYFGDVRANVYALDAATGKQIWKTKVDDQPVARMTASPTLYEDRLYVPLSSTEERAAGYSNTYPCCTFRGSVVALDAATGKQIWKTYVIPEAPKPVGKTSHGITIYAPSGGAVWDSPTVDAKNHALYIGTGDSYNHPVASTTDAVMAMDMNTGKVLWSVQDTQNDAWLSGCGPQATSENCPKDMGPDFDFGAPPILHTLPDGHRILVAAQKSGMLWAHDPDKQGAVVWSVQLVDKLALGMMTFGGAADNDTGYFGLRTGGIAAVDLNTGKKKWFTPIEQNPQSQVRNGETGATTVIPGAVFSGGWDGMLRAFATDDGHLLWQFNMLQDFKTVNGVAAKGGAMGAPGPVIAGGMVFAGSGYVFGGGTPGNVLLAFSPEP